MDFHIDPNQQYPQETTRHSGMNPSLQVLEEIFDPTGSRVPTFRDCVLIALDTDHNSYTHQITQIGVASLDTRDIQKADNEDSDSIKTIISSRLLLLQKRASNKGVYLFGSPEKYYKEDSRDLLLSIFKITDTNSTNLRNVVLIGHSIRSDIQEIRTSTGLNILALSMIKAVVDTSPLINRVYGTTHRYHSLRHTCTLLGMYKRNIHTAGNDAMYALQALLLMFCHFKEVKQSWDFSSDDKLTAQALLYSCQLEAVRRIARCPNRNRVHVKRRRKRERHASLEKENKIRVHDILMTEETEVIGGLFLT